MQNLYRYKIKLLALTEIFVHMSIRLA